MLISILLLLVFTVLGMPFVLLQKQPKDFLFAPILGLAAFVGIGYFISAGFGITGSQSMAVSSSTLLVLTFIMVVISIRNSKYASMDIKKELKSTIFCLLPSILILIPAMMTGVDVFFATVNFDFFYNSQDSNFLTEHSVIQYGINDNGDGILPLTWSAGSQGRFAIALIGSFAKRYLELDPLHFNSQLLTTLVLLFSLSAGAFVKHVYRFCGFRWFCALSAIVLSAGFTQSYTYYLLGQISALPLFLLVLTITSRLMYALEDSSLDKNTRWDFFAIILLLNSLYVFYPILAFFEIVIIGIALAFRVYQDHKSASKIISQFAAIFLGFIAIFILCRVSFLIESKNAILSWIQLSTKTAAASNAPMVFSEYLTEGFLPLLFGVVNYPISSSFFNHFFQNGGVYNCSLLAVGLILIICVVCAVSKFSKHYKQNSALIIALIVTALGCSAVFFITKSGYAIFKISSWFIPLVLPLFIGAIYKPKTSRSTYERILSLLCTLIIIMNGVVAATYLYSLFPSRNENGKVINGFREISMLASKFNPENGEKFLFDLSDGIKNAWAANEFRLFNISLLTHELQPLADRIPPSTPCKHGPIFLENMFLIKEKYDPSTSDVTHEFESEAPIIDTGHYTVYNTEDIETYSFIGKGAFPPVHLPDTLAKASGLPKNIRWIESGVEVFVYSRHPKLVNININIAPGYLIGPKNRHLLITYGQKTFLGMFSKERHDIRLKEINLNAGLNCFYLESKDQVYRSKRPSAVIRSDIPLDFKYLNFALGDFSIQK